MSWFFCFGFVFIFFIHFHSTLQVWSPNHVLVCCTMSRTDRQKTNKLTQNQWHHHSTESQLICPVTQQVSVTWPRVPWTHKCSFESVQSSWIKEHGKQHVSCGSGPGYNQNSLLDCLDQQCSAYPNSSHHNPDLAFQMSPRGPQPFPNRTITKKWVWLMAEDSSGTNTAWHIAISMCCHHHWLYLKELGG